jgi:uncharacterized cupin superfamily protein
MGRERASPSRYACDVQVFRPSDSDLEATSAADRGFAGASAPGASTTRSIARLQSADGGLRSGVWESGPGTADYVFSVDEWAYILEGEATVTASAATHVLRAGDVFYAPAGERMTWVVPAHVRKVWVHRRPPLAGRVRRKLARLVARVR